jgi:hypothetical protein
MKKQISINKMSLIPIRLAITWSRPPNRPAMSSKECPEAVHPLLQDRANEGSLIPWAMESGSEIAMVARVKIKTNQG